MRIEARLTVNKENEKRKRIRLYLDPWMMSARSFVIFPDSTAPMHAASSFSVKSKSRSLLSNVALFTSSLLSNHTPYACEG